MTEQGSVEGVVADLLDHQLVFRRLWASTHWWSPRSTSFGSGRRPGNASEADRGRLEGRKVSLDQCWDLLRQRRALREADRDPEAADVRAPEAVERYER